MKALRTTCPYCGVGCGVAVENGAPKGDTDHPANYGRLCSKGAALKDTLDLPERLLVPTINGREAGWDEALDLIAARFRNIIESHGPDAIAFYVSGQFLTEDYYVANKLMKGFIGSANIDTNSRLCMASSVAGHVRAFGEDIVPGCYEDLEEADLVALAGSNMAWCHPVLYQRLIAARERRGTKIVNIDPRRTATSETAELHLPLAAGTDVLLFNGLLVHLAKSGTVNHDWVGKHVSGFDEAVKMAAASAPSAEFVASATGLCASDVRRFYELFASTGRVVTLYSQGVNQSASGTDKVNAIINCHLATGRIGRAGMGPFSLTGQPNAMGGREVGGLANQLAAHMHFDAPDVDRVRRFWNAPHIATKPGLKAVDLFDAVADGRVQAVWIAATNPAATMPRAGRVREALDRCSLVIVSDAWPTDTTKFADVILPAASWSEKDGTVTNSERRISRQRAFRSAPGSARPDWWMFAEVARRMGWQHEFSYPDPASIFREHAALSAFENNGRRIFDIGALADADYDALTPTQWPCARRRDSNPRLFSDGGFSTPDGRARMIALDFKPAKTHADFPLTLNTGRIRDQWHTMTRTGRVAHLMTHSARPAIALHPHDATQYGLDDGGFARVESAEGDILLRVAADLSIRRGEAFVPMHWTDQFTSEGPIAALVHALCDPTSGQPDLKGTKIRMRPVTTAWHGLLLRRFAADSDFAREIHWSMAPVAGGFAFDLAGCTPLASVIDSEMALRTLLRISRDAELVSYTDPKKAVFRYAGIDRGQLQACVFFAPPETRPPHRDQAANLLGREIGTANRFSLLAGLAPDGEIRCGNIVCSCFSVSEETITAAIRAKDLRTPAQIGALLRAGTNCGSCIPELTKLLSANRLSAVN